jgi:hypothetical protein
VRAPPVIATDPTLVEIEKTNVGAMGVVEKENVAPPSVELGTMVEVTVDETRKSDARAIVAPVLPETLMVH